MNRVLKISKSSFISSASLPAVKPINDGRIGPVLSHNEGHWHATTDLLFWLRFIHCAIVTVSILYYFSFSLTDEQKCKNHCKRDVNDCNGLYLLHHTNGQMHMCMITSSIKIIINAMLLSYTDSSQPGWFYVDTYVCVCSMAMIYQCT